MAMKVIGTIMILVGFFGLCSAGIGSSNGRLTVCRGDGDSCREYRKGDPQFNKEVGYSIVGGLIMIGLGVVFVCVKSDDGEENEN